MIPFVLNIFIIYGFLNTYKKGNIFDFMPTIIKWPVWMMKPLFFCPPCMASVYGIIMFPVIKAPLYYYPIWVLSLSGAIVVLNKFSRQ